MQIRLDAWDRVGLLRDVTSVAADEKVNILSVLTNTHPDRSVTMLMTIEVSGIAQLSHVLSRFENIRDIYEVVREGRDGAAVPAPNGAG